MELKDFLEKMDSGEEIEAGSEYHLFMHSLSQEALRITAEMNNAYRTPDELTVLMKELTGQKVLEDRNIRRRGFGLCGRHHGSLWSPGTSRLSQILVWRLRLWGRHRRHQEGALAHEKSLRNEHCFLKEGACAHTAWFSPRAKSRGTQQT